MFDLIEHIKNTLIAGLSTSRSENDDINIRICPRLTENRHSQHVVLKHQKLEINILISENHELFVWSAG